MFFWAWFSVALFYCYQYILRVSPSVMVIELRHDFLMTAEQFASMGALYLYAYSLLQIPLGILIDRIGVRKIVLFSVALCIAGAITMANANQLIWVQLSRILIGAGSACAFMSALKIAADYLPAGKRGLLMGATLTLGTAGALTAGKPLVRLLESIGWRQTITWTAFLGVVLFVFVFIILRLPKRSHDVVQTHIFSNIIQIIRNRPVMIYAFLAIGLYTPLSILADLWGTIFLIQKYGLTRADAAQTSMMMYLGLAIGSLMLPWISEKWSVLNTSIRVCGLGILFLFTFILFGPPVGIVAVTALLIMLGIFCGAEMMCFAGAAAYTTQSNSGMTLGVVNTLNMLGGALLQQAIGFLLDKRWSGTLDVDGLRIYSSEDFIIALSVLLVVVILCCLLSFRLKN